MQIIDDAKRETLNSVYQTVSRMYNSTDNVDKKEAYDNVLDAINEGIDNIT